MGIRVCVCVYVCVLVVVMMNAGVGVRTIYTDLTYYNEPLGKDHSWPFKRY